MPALLAQREMLSLGLVGLVLAFVWAMTMQAASRLLHVQVPTPRLALLLSAVALVGSTGIGWIVRALLEFVGRPVDSHHESYAALATLAISSVAVTVLYRQVLTTTIARAAGIWLSTLR